MCNYVLKQLVLYQAMHVWTYCSERFVEIWDVSERYVKVLEKCLDYLTEVRLILRYIGLRLPLKSLTTLLDWDWFCYKFELDWTNELTKKISH